MNNNRIIVSQTNAKDTFIRESCHNDNIANKKVSFSFEDFNGDSISFDNYNSYYPTVDSSRNAVADFFDRIKNISRYIVKKLFDPGVKKQLHLNQLEDDAIVNRIERVLIEGYSYPEEKVQQFERLYIEFEISDGKRVFCHMVDGILYPLFIDCNHLIYLNASRSIKAKMSYSIKSSFVKQNPKDLSKEDLGIMDFVESIIEDSKTKSFEKDDILDLLQVIIDGKNN